MARLPVPGGDADMWAEILNEYLLVSHETDGTQKLSSVEANHIKSQSIMRRHLATTNDPDTDFNSVLGYNKQNGSLTWLAQKSQPHFNVKDFGAVGDGSADDTAAIQAAINAATVGGRIDFPSGVYSVTNLKVPPQNGISLHGTGRFGTRIVRRGSSGPLFEISGRGTMDGHLRYFAMEKLMLDGNGQTGLLVRSYYADTCVYRDVGFYNCPSTATEFVEVWDTRFENCTWEDCGSLSEPAMRLCNSTSAGTFGYSNDNTNQIHFLMCRWERFRNGAIWLCGDENNTSQYLNGTFFTACKMETPLLAGPVIQIKNGTTMTFISQLYIAANGFANGYGGGRIDAIVDEGSHTIIRDIFVHWGDVVGLANSTIFAPKSDTHYYDNVSAFYPVEDPAVANIRVDQATNVKLSNNWSNRGRLVSGRAITAMDQDPNGGLEVNLGGFKTGNRSLKATTTEGIDIYNVSNSAVPTMQLLNGVDIAGMAGNYTDEKWRFYGSTGAVRLAAGKFNVEGVKGYAGIGSAAVAGIGLFVKLGNGLDRGLAIRRNSSKSTGRMLEFQDETNNIQGISFDAHGRPVAVSSVCRVTPASKAAYAFVFPQARDAAGAVKVCMSTSAPGEVAQITFSKPYQEVPLSIVLSETGSANGELYVSAKSTTGFMVSSRKSMPGGTEFTFDYQVVG